MRQIKALSNYIYNPRDFKYRVWLPATILLSRSCHWMDHLEFGPTWKLVCQSVLYSAFKVSKLYFLAKNFCMQKDVCQKSQWKKYCLLQFGRFQSLKNVNCYCNCVTYCHLTYKGTSGGWRVVCSIFEGIVCSRTVCSIRLSLFYR